MAQQDPEIRYPADLENMQTTGAACSSFFADPTLLKIVKVLAGPFYQRHQIGEKKQNLNSTRPGGHGFDPPMERSLNFLHIQQELVLGPGNGLESLSRRQNLRQRTVLGDVWYCTGDLERFVGLRGKPGSITHNMIFYVQTGTRLTFVPLHDPVIT
ncbi:hypothetical protein DPMN_001914 [Dreissena polymorpha]|uniref:Uncharacterized protein n=1 Tax=Dreissena polymorpha TaxID=45954 RepID=A0A9D4MLU0_DREPO|nr:hypothetical protein DPMN_001914 [Dreissena polymorpha]